MSPSPILHLEERFRWFGEHCADLVERHPYLCLGLASLAYFSITVYRAQRKLFWFDELFTFYIAQLPGLGSIWNACTHGADFNPPLLYLMTHWSHLLFGATGLGARMPEVLGFWVFCLCIYRFVAVRRGPLAGFIALLFPLTTESYWYAYDARSHGLVIGFFGIALICWQAASDGRTRRWPFVAGLAASLTGAALCHCYAFLLFIPFGIGELTRSIRRRRLDPFMWAALLFPAVVSASVVLPLLLALKGARIPGTFAFRPQILLGQWNLFFDPRLALCVMLLLSVQALAPRAWQVSGKEHGANAPRPFAAHEIAILGGLLASPVFAFAAATLLRVPDYGRYALIAVGGVACVVGAGCTRSRITGLAVLLLSILFVAEGFARFYAGSQITEPSMRLEVGTRSAAQNLAFQSITASAPGNDPIVLADNLEFASVFYYAPASLRSRFVFLVPDMNGKGYARLQRCCNAPGTVMSRSTFLAAHRSFFMYGPLTRMASQAAVFRRKGGQITVEACGEGHCLYRVVFLPSQTALRKVPA